LSSSSNRRKSAKRSPVGSHGCHNHRYADVFSRGQSIESTIFKHLSPHARHLQYHALTGRSQRLGSWVKIAVLRVLPGEVTADKKQSFHLVLQRIRIRRRAIILIRRLRRLQRGRRSSNHSTVADTFANGGPCQACLVLATKEEKIVRYFARFTAATRPG
jgi:hypothetical protein